MALKRRAGEKLLAFDDHQNKVNANYHDPSKLIGAGTYGRVFESPIKGQVIKQNHPGGYATPESMTAEADIQSKLADMGLAPRVHAIETFPEGTTRIEMDDVRPLYRPVQTDSVGMPSDPKVNLSIAKDRGRMILQGFDLGDRRGANVVRHPTGRTFHLDGGIHDANLTPDMKAQRLAEATADGFAAAGIPEMGDVLTEVVADYLEGGQVKEAWDVARQGYSRLAKIKEPAATNTMTPEDYQMHKMLEMMAAQGRERGLA